MEVIFNKKRFHLRAEQWGYIEQFLIADKSVFLKKRMEPITVTIDETEVGFTSANILKGVFSDLEIPC